NHYNHVKAVDKGKTITWAPAAIIAADKVSFYACAFIGVQDTLFDARGRHYFEYCYIEGALDFIFGDGQSYYERCKLNVTTRLLGPGRHKGYITAQGRESAEESSGFVFRFNSIIGFGTGPTFLGRAYRNHSRVFFYKTYMDNNITPEGWSAWKNVGHE
ncbi:Pectinesterase, Tyr active site, partial [Parasponia andersonii]